MDWNHWHEPYKDANSPLSRRLAIIQRHINTWLDVSSPVEPRVLSVCAGDGRDLLQVLASREDRGRVSGTLIELDPDLCAAAGTAISRAGITGVQVHCADAGAASVYEGVVPADLVLLAGVFGNISDADVRTLIGVLPSMCRSRARLIWTRHRGEPDLTSAIRRWLGEESFVELAFDAPDDVIFSVGVHDFIGSSSAWDPPDRLFTFIR